MGRGIHKLSAVAVTKEDRRGYHGDGGGLWLQVSQSGTKSWIFRYARHGKTRNLGLGPYPDVTLKAARDKATELRGALARGEDPMAERAAAKAQAASRMTFDQCSAAYIAAHRGGWKNPKHAEQWTNTLATYASPVIGSLDVAHVATQHVVRILERDDLWLKKNETASRVRGRIERVLAWATTRHLRTGDNPARWRHHLDTLLPPPGKVQKEKHHEAMPYRAVAAFIQELRKQPGVAARALEFTILTAARTGETIGMQWHEADLAQNIWTVPAGRMKASKEHVIPLSARAVELLKEMQAARDADDGCEFVFPGWTGDKGLSNMAMLKLLKDMGHTGLTVHGFRSTFRDWAGEQTHHAREVIEHALAHQLKDRTEAAYQRGTLFDKRRALMDDWATYIETPQPAAPTAIAA
ncbi:tyrosine-type recombinase/integrase [Burkholderia multivorans]|uniref:tyrosine-type recombinase/integrase n=1 Tax=Burkholderia multivorans TaxID=87883 RepID=UPI002018A73E|nr:site-specific integrase [Burkholderia multivorans]MCO1361320.1 integrase arm-type DNA-binding domain-containing protein [Burkholderia multivorans]MCO1421091.1 integrase arm-type DNA-binding domain-containing protein [Burkholderia multivorans]MDR9053462.1 Prophage integrase IntS [Burkholderia multivorans]MDR9060234.1 Prophage integrase IntS [Burkholderia multivorans]MDR9066488.1 Prophage integrase IntS [Burkholderia multivorans]